MHTHPSCTGLSFDICTFEHDAIRALLAGLERSSVTSLHLRGCSHGEEELKGFVALSRRSVEDLDLARNLIGDEGLVALAPGLMFSAVTNLDLTENGIGAEGAQALASILPGSRIRSLNLAFNQIGDQGLRALAAVLKDTCISCLNVASNHVEDGGVQCLAAGLASSSVTSLDLSANAIGQAGGEALLQSLSESALRELPFRRENYRLGLSGALWTQIMVGLCFNRVKNMGETFILQMQHEQLETALKLTFRTLGGTVAAVITRSAD